ncbi:MAG: hypothetical protein AAFV49_18090 [Pseudomonadota bacterium]
MANGREVDLGREVGASGGEARIVVLRRQRGAPLRLKAVELAAARARIPGCSREIEARVFRYGGGAFALGIVETPGLTDRDLAVALQHHRPGGAAAPGRPSGAKATASESIDERLPREPDRLRSALGACSGPVAVPGDQAPNRRRAAFGTTPPAASSLDGRDTTTAGSYRDAVSAQRFDELLAKLDAVISELRSSASEEPPPVRNAAAAASAWLARFRSFALADAVASASHAALAMASAPAR